MDKKQVQFDLGQLIKHYRKERRFTQNRLAKKLKISSRMLQYIEAGKRSITVYRLYEIAISLKISPVLLIKDFRFN